MTHDDWDSVSSDTQPDSSADAWDAVSESQPSRKRRIISDNLALDNLVTPGQDPQVTPPESSYEDIFEAPLPKRSIISMPFLKKAGIFTGITILVVIGSLSIFAAMNYARENVAVTATAEAKTTPSVQVVAITPGQQIYNQATSGTPAIDDPLSDNRNNWGIFSTSWSGKCTFSGGAYHPTVSNPGNTIWCNSSAVSNLKNFALQVGITVVQGDYGSIVFGQDTNGQYSVDIHPNGTYALYQSIKNQSSDFLRQDFSSAIRQGLNQINVITIVVNNNQFYFYANKQLLMSYYLPLYSGGGLDLAAVCVNQPTDVAYSNLKVWTL